MTNNGVVREGPVLVLVDEGLDRHPAQVGSDQIALDRQKVGAGLAQVVPVLLVELVQVLGIQSGSADNQVVLVLAARALIVLVGWQAWDVLGQVLVHSSDKHTQFSKFLCHLVGNICNVDLFCFLLVCMFSFQN